MASLVIPRFVVLRSNGDKYLRYVKEGEYRRHIKCDGIDILDPLSKFRVERSSSNPDLVHIRCCYNNRYLARVTQGSNWVAAASDTADEDQSKWSCTLFRPVSNDNMTFRFQHVQNGNNLCNMQMPGVDNDLCLAVRWSEFDRNGWDLFTFTDWESLVILPKHVAVKGDNGKYLYNVNRNVDLVFGANDIGDRRVGEDIFSNSDGSIRVKNRHSGRFWRLRQGVIVPESMDESDSDPATSFWPVRIKENAIALRSKANDRYLRRTNLLGLLVDGLATVSSATTIDRQSYLVLEELVNRRQIYDVNYRLENARVYDESIVTLARSCVTNMGNETATLEVLMSYNQQRMYTVSTATSSSSSISIGMSMNIPSILDAGIDTTETTGSDYEWGTTVNSSIPLTRTVPVSVNPMTKMTLTLVATLGFCEVPFSYIQQDTLINGQLEITEKHDGIFTGANCFRFRTEASDEPL